MSDMFTGNMLTGMTGEALIVPNLINFLITPQKMKALYENCLRVDILDNNEKADIVSKILGPEFDEIGTGTNRTALYKNGVVVKVALDRRGLVDNFQEFKRSTELPQFLAKTYESNFLINICEYVEVMDQDKFLLNESTIKEMLTRLSRAYLFEDLGFTLKNSYNWGIRESAYDFDNISDEYTYDICILDYGYLYPLHDQEDKVMRCPKCRHKLKWNSNFTGLVCGNTSCNYQATPMEVRARMDKVYDDLENKIIAETISNLKMPNLAHENTIK